MTRSHCLSRIRLLVVSCLVFSYQAFVSAESSLLHPVRYFDDDDKAPDCDHHSSRYDALACWLYRLSIDIPDEEIKKGIFSVSIRDMVCTNVTLGSMGSNYTPSNHTSNPLVSVDLSGVSATCKGKYKSTGMSGTVRASVIQKDDGDKNMKVAMEFVSSNWNNSNTNNIRMATAIKTSACTMSGLEVPSHGGIHFSGSISAKLIDLFSQPLAKYISSTLGKQLCPLLQDKVDPLLTKAIRKANDYMTSLIPENQTQLAVVSASSDLVDFARDTPLLTWASDVLNQVVLNRYLNKGLALDLLDRYGNANNSTTIDCPDCGFFFHGINGVIHSLTRGSVRFQIPDFLHHLKNFTIVIPKYGEVTIVIGEIQLGRLDTLSKVELMRNVAPQDLVSTVISDEGFNVEANVSITVKSIDGGMFRGDPLREDLVVKVNSSSVSLVGNVVADINRTLFMDMTVQDVKSSITSAVQDYNYSGLDCLLKPLETMALSNILAEVNLSSLEIMPALNMSRVESSILSGNDSLEGDVDKLVNHVLSLYTAEYGLLLNDFAAGLINGPVKKKINNYFADWKSSLPLNNASNPGSCSDQPANSTVPDYFDFRQGNLLPTLNRLLQRNSTLQAINAYINCVSNYVNHCLSPSVPVQFGGTDGVATKIRDLKFENFGSLKELDVLDPSNDGRAIFNSLSVGTCTNTNNSTTCPHAPRASISIDFSYPRMNLSGHFNATVSIGDIALNGGIKLYYDMAKAGTLTIAQLLTREQCSAVPVSEMDLYGFSLDFGFLNLNMSSSLESNTFDPIHFDLDFSKKNDIFKFVSPLLSWSVQSVQDVINELSGILLETSSQLCAGDNVPNNRIDNGDDSHEIYSEEKLLWRWNLIFIALAFVVAQVSVALRLKWNDPEGRLADESELSEPLLPTQSDSNTREVYELEIMDDRESFAGGGSTSLALVSDASIPSYVRHLLPIATVVTIWLLLASNMSIGASVDMQLSLRNSDPVSLPSLFEFSLGNTVREFYHARIWALLFLVLGFSGMWPYIKLKLMLFSWCAPRSWLSKEKREQLLLALDALGKFSLVDTYVLVLMVVAFRFHLDIADDVVIDVFVTPGLGFFGFLLATCSSLVIGHVMLFFHRKASIGTLPSSERRESLCTHEFVDKVNGRLRRVSVPFRVFVVCTLLVAIALLAVGATKECFNFEFGGLAGVALGYNRVRRYSMLSLGSAIRLSSQDPSSLGIIMIEVAYLFYALIMPIACLGLLLILFCCPMTLKTQHLLLAAAEITNAWSAVEVFVISIIAALLEISTFADFMVGNKCDLINQVLADNFDKELGGHDTCFSVNSSVGAEAWVLTAGVVLNSFLVSFLLRLMHRLVSERLCRENGEPFDILADAKEDGERAGLVDRLLASEIGRLIFSDDTEPVAESEGQEQPLGYTQSKPSASRIWEEWRKVCSWT